MSLLNRIFHISPGESKPVIFSFLFFFSLMSSYFILKPVRDEMAILAGVENLQWLFTATFVSMLLVVPVFWFITKRVSRRTLIPSIYLFFSLNILLFRYLFEHVNERTISIMFFIWLSVFNLFVISVFWSFTSDFFSTQQAKRLYGPIAAGGSAGAIFGPLVTTFLMGRAGMENLLFLSAFFLLLAAWFIRLLIRTRRDRRGDFLRGKMKGGVWQGLSSFVQSRFLRHVGLFVLLYTGTSTFLYFEQAHIISGAFSSSAERGSYFGLRDLLINLLTLFIQCFLTERVIRKRGVVFCLTLVPAFSVAGFLLLTFTQSVVILLVIQVIYTALNHSVQRPVREVLFTSLSVEEKYRSKNFIDTALHRGGDALSGWIFTGASYFIVSLKTMALLTVPVALVWVWVGRRAGKLFNHKNINFYDGI